MFLILILKRAFYFLLAVMSPPLSEPDCTPPLFDNSVPDIHPMETSLEDSAVGPDLPPEAPVETTYHLVLEGTIRGKTKLSGNQHGLRVQHQKKMAQRNHRLTSLPCSSGSVTAPPPLTSKYLCSTWETTGSQVQCGLPPAGPSTCCQ